MNEQLENLNRQKSDIDRELEAIGRYEAARKTYEAAPADEIRNNIETSFDEIEVVEWKIYLQKLIDRTKGVKPAHEVDEWRDYIYELHYWIKPYPNDLAQKMAPVIEKFVSQLTDAIEKCDEYLRNPTQEHYEVAQEEWKNFRSMELILEWHRTRKVISEKWTIESILTNISFVLRDAISAIVVFFKKLRHKTMKDTPDAYNGKSRHTNEEGGDFVDTKNHKD